jgi:hypothetical protein
MGPQVTENPIHGFEYDPNISISKRGRNESNDLLVSQIIVSMNELNGIVLQMF